MAYEHIIVETKEPGIGIVTLNRPERLNALSRRMMDETLDVLEEWKNDLDIRAVIITGAGRGFCSGGDVSGDAIPTGGYTTTTQSPLPHRMQRARVPLGHLALYLRDYPKPTIAAINGACVGAGLGLAMSCDMRVVVEDAKLSVIFVKRGVSPDFSTSYFLPRLVGLGRAMELACSGRMISVEEADRIGLVNQVVPPGEALSAAVRMATELAIGPPIALSFIKKLIHHSLDNNMEDHLYLETYAQDITRTSEDSEEGMKSFREKRAPVFKGL